MNGSWPLCLALLVCSLSGTISAAEIDFSGHLRGFGSVDYYSGDHLLSSLAEQHTFLNGSLDGRLNLALYPGDHLSFELAYEGVLAGGQSRSTISEAIQGNHQATEKSLFQRFEPTANDNFFSLTKIISEEPSYLLYQRIDRMVMRVDSELGTVGIGRQAVTWGNGMLFNPADLINPFAPSDIIRDYKMGSDMILYQKGGRLIPDLQLVAVPRRDPEDNEFSSSESTAGMKMKVSFNQQDFDFYLLKDYQDPVAGAGFTTYLGDGVFRSDLIWTYLEDHPDLNSFFSAVANYDFSWVWLGKNWYGFGEYYYNGLGSDSVGEALRNEALVTRLQRGEIFVTGRNYLDGLLQCELHPLINIYATIIYNLDDQSFLLQPRLSWDFHESARLLAGFNVFVGTSGSEFGSQPDPQTGLDAGNGDQVYLVLTWYF